MTGVGGLKQSALSRFFAKVPKPECKPSHPPPPPPTYPSHVEGCSDENGIDDSAGGGDESGSCRKRRLPATPVVSWERSESSAGEPCAGSTRKKARGVGAEEAFGVELAALSPSEQGGGDGECRQEGLKASQPVTSRCSGALPTAIAPRDPRRHSTLQHKLVDNGAWKGSTGGAGASGSGGGVGNANNPAPGSKLTPLEQQVVELKRKHPDVLLVVEVGYKMRFFGDDAETAASVCNIMAYPDHNFLTASIPVQRLHVHVRRLVRAGHKVGLVRQTESAALKAAGSNRGTPFIRELTAVLTPATLDAGDVDTGGQDSTDHAPADSSLSNQLMLVLERNVTPTAVELALLAVDCVSGSVQTATLRDGPARSGLEAALIQVAPAELLLPDTLSPASEKLLAAWTASSSREGSIRVERFKCSKYDTEGVRAAVAEIFADSVAEAALKLSDMEAEGLVHVLEYLKGFSMERVLAQAGCFRPLSGQQEMQLTPNCLTHLEVLQNSDDGGHTGSLLWLLSQTLTPGGNRLLRRWVSHPLTNLNAIQERLDAVEELRDAVSGEQGSQLLSSLPTVLKALPDLEAGVTRMLHRTASPAEAYRVLDAFATLPTSLGIRSKTECLMGGSLMGGAAGGELPISGVQSQLLKKQFAAATDGAVVGTAIELLAQLHQRAAEQNDVLGLMKDSERFPEVFQCLSEVQAAEQNMQDILKLVRKETQRPALKYVEIQNQGQYLIEVPVNSAVPQGWAKVCSTKAVARYHPPAVKDGIVRLEMAREHHRQACKAAWLQFLDDFAMHYKQFRGSAAAVTELDALLSLGKVSSGPGFCRPTFVDANSAPRIMIRGGRHPMLDTLLHSGCVPNDTLLTSDGGGHSAMLVTGPNMGGKSCFIRQSALIVMMAQIGCFVPADSAEMHVVDCIFTRMGASDNIAAGRSTFQVELAEASYILSNATSRSLVIIDELGRGTSTHDGVAIASATLEHLVASQRCLSLFVTHYPQLCQLCSKFPDRLGAYFMAYAQEGGDAGSEPGKGLAAVVPRISFLYKLTSGVAESSFGMNVAALAGLPLAVVGRAYQRAADIERDVAARQVERRSGAVYPYEKLLAVCRELLGEAAGEGEVDRLVDLQKNATCVLTHSK